MIIDEFSKTDSILKVVIVSSVFGMGVSIPSNQLGTTTGIGGSDATNKESWKSWCYTLQQLFM